MRKKRFLKAITATVVAAIVATTSLIPAFAAKGTRTIGRSSITWSQNIKYEYAAGSKPVVFSKGSGFVFHYFKEGENATDVEALDNLAYCIEPEKGVELSSSGELIYKNADNADAYKRLDKNTQKLLNLVLANGYGNRRVASNSDTKKAYYYATQLLCYEVVSGIRYLDSWGELAYKKVDGQGAFTPSTYLSRSNNSSEPQISTIQTAYDNMLSWIALCTKRASQTTSTDSDNLLAYSEANANSFEMSYNYDTHKYEYTFTDKTGVLRHNYYTDGSNGEKESELNIRNSDITVGSEIIEYSLSHNSSNQCVIKFTTDKEISKANAITVQIKNPVLRGLKTMVNNGSGGLMICKPASTSTWAQCYARGADVPQNEFYLKLYTNVEKIGLQVIKESSNTNISSGNSMYSLDGAVFNVYSNADCTDDHFVFTLDSIGNGTYNCPSSVPNTGTYYVKEMVAPDGYELCKDVIAFTDSGEVNRYGQKIFRAKFSEVPGNDPLYIFLQKIPAGAKDENYNKADLAGAQYQMEYFDGYYNSNEEIISAGATPLRTWVFRTDEAGLSYYDESCKVSGDLLYIDSKTQTPALPYGTVRVKEISAPTSGKYELSDEIFVRIIDGKTWTEVDDKQIPKDVLKAEETSKSAGLTIKKSSDDNVVKDLWFRVQGDNGYNEVFSTNDSGSIRVEGLDIYKRGTSNLVTYTVTELGVRKDDGTYYIPQRYTPDKVSQTVQLSIDSNVSVEFHNMTQPGQINIEKTANDDYYHDYGLASGTPITANDSIVGVSDETQPNPVNKVYFKITSTNGYNQVFVTNQNGKINVKSLPVYDSNDNLISYTIEELGYKDGNTFKLPNKYYKPVNQTVTLNTGSTPAGYNSQTVRFFNEVKVSSITLKKEANDGYIEGVIFSLMADGKLADNSYFMQDNVNWNFDGYGLCTEANGVYTIKNLPIYNESGKKIVYKLKEMGMIVIPNGTTYRIEHVLGQYKWNLDEFTQTFSLDESNTAKPLEIKFVNERSKLNIHIRKGASDEQIEDVWFNVKATGYSIMEKKVVTIFNKNYNTDANGNIKIEDLWAKAEGQNNSVHYVITELGYKQADGTFKISDKYIVDPIKEFDSKDYSTNIKGYVPTVNIDFFNQLKSGTIKVQKVSEDNIIEGIYFEVTGSNGSKYGPSATDDKGIALFENLPILDDNGNEISYKVKELGLSVGNGKYEVPFRYKPNQVQTVTLKYDPGKETIETITFTNELKTGSLTIVKKDNAGKPISGVEFRIKSVDVSGSSIDISQKTDASGTVKFSNLKTGSYDVYEVATKGGFNLLARPERITIKADKETTLNQTLEITETDTPDIPSVGGINVILYIALSGLALLVAGSAAFIVKNRKTKKEADSSAD